MDIRNLKKVEQDLKKNGVNIHDLYILHCVLNSISAFEKIYTDEKIDDLCEEVDYLWLENEDSICISKISDFVVENADKLKDMDKWEKLEELSMY